MSGKKKHTPSLSPATPLPLPAVIALHTVHHRSLVEVLFQPHNPVTCAGSYISLPFQPSLEVPSRPLSAYATALAPTLRASIVPNWVLGIGDTFGALPWSSRSDSKDLVKPPCLLSA